MLKRRIIGVIIIKDSIAVQSIGFKRYLPIGKPEIVAEFLNQWGIDEIIALDISASKSSRAPNYKLVERLAKYALVPLTFGGGISSRDQMAKVLSSGADKICLNQALWEKPELIKIGSEYFGQQAIVAAVDCLLTTDGSYQVWNYAKSSPSSELSTHLKTLLAQKPGEFFINSVNNDGLKLGFDLKLLKIIEQQVDIPVIACGGAGNAKHFADILKEISCSGVAAANFFNYTEHSVNTLKAYLVNEHLNIRHDAYTSYLGYEFLENTRIARHSDTVLEALRFTPVVEEKI